MCFGVHNVHQAMFRLSCTALRRGLCIRDFPAFGKGFRIGMVMVVECNDKYLMFGLKLKTLSTV